MGLFARRSPLKFTVFFVTAGEVAAFRMVESFSAGSIDVNPVLIPISEIGESRSAARERVSALSQWT